MLRTLSIKNFKSIVDLTLELGRFNVFIGENGCGKSNILEALAMSAGYSSNRLGNEDLLLRGMRIAKPSLMASAFVDSEPSAPISLILQWWAKNPKGFGFVDCLLTHQGEEWVDPRRAVSINALQEMIADSGPSSFSKTMDAVKGMKSPEASRIFHHDFATLLLPELMRTLATAVQKPRSKVPGKSKKSQAAAEKRRKEEAANRITLDLYKEREGMLEALGPFAIFCADTAALRGLQRMSRKEPVGLYGEGLDVAIAQFSEQARADLVRRARAIAWLDDIEIDAKGTRKLQGDKPGRSESELYFADKYLSEDRRVFSAENANEGVLHMLFHLVLFMHPKAPPLLAIDNVEGTLNPRLCTVLTAELVELAKANNRQALVTTHNPAVLDGLNLHDDEQRLFVVSRNDEGHTEVERIQYKPKIDSAETAKLSELWMRGLIGGIPHLF